MSLLVFFFFFFELGLWEKVSSTGHTNKNTPINILKFYYCRTISKIEFSNNTALVEL
jgi:hypothetical protein